MNSGKKNRGKEYHSFQHKVVKNNRKVKLNSARSASDNIFISGPVQYQPDDPQLNPSNFVDTTTTNHHHSSRSRNNAWGNNKNNSGNKSRSQTMNSSSQNTNTHNNNNGIKSRSNQHQNVAAPMPRRFDNAEFPALSESITPKLKPQTINNHTQNTQNQNQSQSLHPNNNLHHKTKPNRPV